MRRIADQDDSAAHPRVLDDLLDRREILRSPDARRSSRILATVWAKSL
jgi:hypothetical protein